MARPLRIEFVGALYHVTSRDDGQEDVYLDGTLEVLVDVQHRFNWAIHAYCLVSIFRSFRLSYQDNPALISSYL